MITFKLEDKDAQGMVAILNAAAGHASFLNTLNEQFNSQFAPSAPVVAVEEAPKAKSKTKAAEAIEGDK